MVLKHQRSKSIQNFKFYDSSTFKQNLSNNTNTRICNATSNVTLNDNPDYRIRDHSNNTRTLNSKNSSPLLIYHQNIRGLQNKIDEVY